MRRCVLRALLWLVMAGGLSGAYLAAGEETALSEYNQSVPFCYLRGGVRTWPILSRKLEAGESLTLTARQADEVLGTGQTLRAGLVELSITEDGKLRVDALAEPRDVSPLITELEVQVLRDGQAVQSQKLVLRPSPPLKPISYIADLVDDLIRMYGRAETGEFLPISKGALDQYFRRLQAHGVSRLIVWHSPFPYFTRPEDHDPDDWSRYEKQTRAILSHPELGQALRQSRNMPSWLWMKFLLAMRLNPDAGPMFVQSAAEHGISLSASFRPFESALTKYYEVPTFDASGDYLWGFLPLAMPVVTYQPDRVCFGHYREVLNRMGHPELGRLTTLELPGLTREEAEQLVARFGPTGGFEVHAAQFPPIDSDSYVLVRQASGEFQLQPYHQIRETTEARRRAVTGFRLETSPEGIVQLRGIDVPHELRFLTLSHAGTAADNLPVMLDKELPVQLRSQAGNRLNRETIYWVFDEGTPAGHECRIAGITPTGEYRAVFQACASSIQTLLKQQEPRVPLLGNQVVIDRGNLWSVEMLDFQQPATRDMAVKQLKTLLGLRGDDPSRPVYDEIFISTRSHVDLATTMADGDEGQKPISYYYRIGRGPRHHLGLDKAYAPRSAATNPRLIAAAKSPLEVEQITTWQDQEWRDSCQSPDSPLIWRLARNEAVAEGVSQLLRDLEREFPGTRIRAIVPPREAMIERVEQALETMPVPTGGTYGRAYYHKLWCSNNHIPTIGEGMAMVDLRGTRVEPVFLGSGGYLPEQGPFELFVKEQIADLADNRGSAFRGPRSYFYEGQFTLRANDAGETRKRRDEMIRFMLSQKGEISEVLLYEAADWLYFVQLSEADPWASLE
ncbi:MAG: hypothetical protein U0929_16830 [Planctomycetaceae bacterium]